MTQRDTLSSWLGSGPTAGVEADEVLARLRRGMFATQAPPPSLGRYRDLEPLGRGGMAVVYRGWDQQLGRHVAVKLLRVEATGDRRRLRREAQVMAALSHPNVVQVLDFGEHRAEAFIVMELVRGSDAAAWLRHGPRDPDRILAVFAAAGRGLAAAHAVGIVHRDFKPSNVLVGSDGRVRVTDFGLAGFGRRGSQGNTPRSGPGPDGSITATGARLGTPRYMAPEQYADGTADSRSDQWAFAASVWESLCGQHPCEGADGGRVDHLVASTPGSIPPRVARALRRALDPDPARRFPRLSDLLAALEARPGDPRPRRRMLAVAALGGLVIGVPLWTRGAQPQCDPQGHLRGVWSEARRTRIAGAFAASDLPYGPGAWKVARPRIDAWIGGWTEQYVAACSAAPAGLDDIDPVMVCLRGELRELDALLEVFSQPDAAVVLRSDEATATLSDPGDCRGAGYARRWEGRAEPGHVERMARVRAHVLAGRYAQAASLAEAARTAAAGQPAALRQASLALGMNRTRSSDPAGAIDPLQEAFYSAAADTDAVVAAQAAVALVRTATRAADQPAGDRWARHAETWIGRLDPASAKGRALARELATARAIAMVQRGRYDDALVALEQAWAACGHDPDHPQAFRLFNQMGLVAIEQGEYAKAVTLFERSMELFERNAGPDNPRAANVTNNLGNAHYYLADYDAAQHAYRRAYEVRLAALGPIHDKTATSIMNLGVVADARGDYPGALRHFEHAVQVFTESLGAEHPSTAQAIGNLAATLSRAGDRQGSARENRRALAIYLAHYADDHPHVAHQRDNLASALRDLGDFEGALAEHERALGVAQRTLGPGHPRRGHILHNIATAKRRLGRRSAAHDADIEALLVLEQALGPDHPQLAPVLVTLSHDALVGGRFEEARARSERARALGSPRAMTRGQAALYLARAHAALGDEAPVPALVDEAHDALTEAGERAAVDLAALARWRADRRSPITD